VPGRIRLHVTGLHGRPELKTALEHTLGGRDEIRRVSASTLTSNVLVIFDPRSDAQRIIGLVDVVVRGPIPQPAPVVSAGPAPGSRNVWGTLAGWFRLFRERSARVPVARSAYVVTRAGRAVLPAPERMDRAWHAAGAAEALAFWEASPTAGLSAQRAAQRLQKYGFNELPAAEPRSGVLMFVEQFKTLPVALLGVSAVVSLVTGGIGDAVVVGAVVLLNALIGTLTELQAERTIAALMTVTEPVATALRNGSPALIPAEEVVPGDVVVLARGGFIAADARLIAAESLTIDESALTGESMPVEKSAEMLANTIVPLAERCNMVYRGTVVTGGSGLAVVVATGPHTEIGRIHSLIARAAQPLTPLQQQMHRLGNQMLWLTGLATGAVVLIGLLRRSPPLELLKTAISLAVAAVPEGLPAVATTALAASASTLASQKVLVRRLEAIEALGCVQVVCFDKTGTLTLNRMSAVAVFAGMQRYSVRGGRLYTDQQVHLSEHPELLRLLEVCCLCSEAEIEEQDGRHVVTGSGTEAALVRMAVKSGIDLEVLRRSYPLLLTTNRAVGRNYMATTHTGSEGRKLVAMKGSPSEVLELCEWFAQDGAVHPMTAAHRSQVAAENQRMAAGALRVLGAAYHDSAEPHDGAASGLVWLGLVGIADPPRQGMADILDGFRSAGVRPVMVTGDQAATARAIAEMLGLNGHGGVSTVDAAEFERLNDAELTQVASEAHVFARVSPAQKLKLVRALQSGGRTVAMAGDGVNDGPALKAADVGVALGQGGTEVAREVAEVVLAEDNLDALLDAIREGRRVHSNIREAIRYIASTNMAEVMVTLAGLGAGLGAPLNARQLLWINLISDIFPEMAIALGPAGGDLMRRPPPDPSAPVIGQAEYRRLGSEAAVMAGSALASYAYGFWRYGGGPLASSLAFLTLASAQLLHALCGSTAASRENKHLSRGVAAGVGLLGVSQLVPGLRTALGMSRVGALDALVAAGTAAASFVVNRAGKGDPAAGSGQASAIRSDAQYVRAGVI
jgi:Ca2+-transporting ATPase